MIHKRMFDGLNIERPFFLFMRKGIIKLQPNGKCGTREYKAFFRIMNDENETMICRSWIMPGGFERFLIDVGPSPGRDHILTKINTDGYYEPTNVFWKRKINMASRINFIFKTCQTHDELKQPGVYRLIFDNKYFYIGSSKCLKTRLNIWVQSFKTGRMHNKKMKECSSSCQSVCFETLEYTSVENAKSAENKYLLTFLGDEYLLNRSFDAHSNKGVKWTEEEKASMSAAVMKMGVRGRPKKKIPAIRNRCPVVIDSFDLQGVGLGRFPSVREAAKYFGLNHKRISRVINGLSKSTNGYIFKRAVVLKSE